MGELQNKANGDSLRAWLLAGNLLSLVNIKK
jgi:hypothetical protein